MFDLKSQKYFYEYFHVYDIHYIEQKHVRAFFNIKSKNKMYR